MSYTYKIEYQLTEPLTDNQLAAMQAILDKPWTPPPGYTGQVIKAKIEGHPEHCCGCECWPTEIQEPEHAVTDVSPCFRSSNCILTHNHQGDCELRYP